jgi:hypothetical protein
VFVKCDLFGKHKGKCRFLFISPGGWAGSERTLNGIRQLCPFGIKKTENAAVESVKYRKMPDLLY